MNGDCSVSSWNLTLFSSDVSRVGREGTDMGPHLLQVRTESLEFPDLLVVPREEPQSPSPQGVLRNVHIRNSLWLQSEGPEAVGPEVSWVQGGRGVALELGAPGEGKLLGLSCGESVGRPSGYFTVNEAGSPHQGTRGAPGDFLQSCTAHTKGRVWLEQTSFFF